MAAATGQTYESFLRYYDGYGQDLKGIVIGGKSDGTTYSEISFMPTAGYEVSLLDFDFAGYPVGSANIQAVPFKILSGGVSPVPEPATWAMMIAGFGLAGGAIRARRRLMGLASA